MALIDLRLEPERQALISGLASFFAGRGVQAYATGGFLRDALLDLPVRDVDISISGDPLALGPGLADALGGHYFALDADKRQARVLLADGAAQVDLLPLQGDVEADLRRRDYTIDAMACRLEEAAAGSIELIDPLRGLGDLRARIVRTTGEGALIEDPLRLLRGVRLAVQIDFEFEAQTAGLIRRHATLITTAAVERQRDELMRIFGTPRAGRGMRLLDELGLLGSVLPEMEAARGVEQPKEHHWDVLGHSLAAVEGLDILLSAAEPAAQPGRNLWRALWSRLGWWTEARAYFSAEVVMGTPRSAVLKLAGFLHDIGKPETKTFDETGRMRFFGHGDVGAAIAVRLMQRLRFSSREVDLVRPMLEAHLRPVQMAQQGPPTRRAVYRFFRDTGDAGIDTLFLSLADHLATVGPRLNMEGWRQHVAVVDYVLQMRLQDTGVVAPPRLLRGDELMAALELPPGPALGRLLEEIREAQAAGEISTREEALKLARRSLDQAGSAPPGPSGLP